MRIRGFKDSRIPVTGKASVFLVACCGELQTFEKLQGIANGY